MPIEEALTLATHAASLTVTSAGAQPAIPSREQVDQFVKECTSNN